MTDWTPSEPEEILDIFRGMLSAATSDGAAKRRAGTKVSWKVDEGHKSALYRHLSRWEDGEAVDADSGAHPLVHVAWRALAIAWQETHRPEPAPAPKKAVSETYVTDPADDEDFEDISIFGGW